MSTFFQLIINGIAIGSIYSSMAIGLTLIFGILKVINFAHGQMIMLSLYGTYWLFRLWGIDPYVSIFILAPLFFLIGVVIERLVIHRLMDATAFSQIFATYGIGLILTSGALMLWGADYRDIMPSYVFNKIQFFSIPIGLCNLITIIINMITLITLFLFLNKTYLGKAIRGLAQERRGAMIVGINVPLLYTITFGIGIAYASIAASSMGPLYSIYPDIGDYLVLVTFVAVILGGYNSLMGTFIAGLLIGLIEVFTGYYLSSNLKEIMYFMIFIIILIFKPTGLLGQEER